MPGPSFHRPAPASSTSTIDRFHVDRGLGQLDYDGIVLMHVSDSGFQLGEIVVGLHQGGANGFYPDG